MQQLRLTDYSDELSLGQHLEKHSNGPEKNHTLRWSRSRYQTRKVRDVKMHR